MVYSAGIYVGNGRFVLSADHWRRSAGASQFEGGQKTTEELSFVPIVVLRSLAQTMSTIAGRRYECGCDQDEQLFFALRSLALLR